MNPLDTPCTMLFYLGYLPDNHAIAISIPTPIIALIAVLLFARLISSS